jgi:methylmalonyl-CoA mutase N-terminal domain/subunit
VIKAAEDGTNLFIPILAAVKADATLGEIITALKGVFGTYVAASGF